MINFATVGVVDNHCVLGDCSVLLGGDFVGCWLKDPFVLLVAGNKKPIFGYVGTWQTTAELGVFDRRDQTGRGGAAGSWGGLLEATGRFRRVRRGY